MERYTITIRGEASALLILRAAMTRIHEGGNIFYDADRFAAYAILAKTASDMRQDLLSAREGRRVMADLNHLFTVHVTYTGKGCAMCGLAPVDHTSDDWMVNGERVVDPLERRCGHVTILGA